MKSSAGVVVFYDTYSENYPISACGLGAHYRQEQNWETGSMIEVRFDAWVDARTISLGASLCGVIGFA